MIRILKFLRTNTLFRAQPFYWQPKVVSRLLSTTVPSWLKEIVVVNDGNQLTVEGKIVPSPRELYLLKSTSDACPVCATNLDIKHTDVLILSQFVRSDGCMLPRRTTGLCRLQQKRISSLVAMAQKAGLMSNLTPANSKKDPTRRKDWKKYNTYFDESTIKPPKDRKKLFPL